MWDESLIETKQRAQNKRWWMFPLSVFLHAMVIGAIIGASFWFVEAVQPPPIPVTLLSAPPPPPPPPPAARKPAPKKEEPKPEPKIEPKEVQPTEIPEETQPDPTEESPEDVEGGITPEEGGMEGGVESGVMGGVPGGVVGGVPGGVVGGVPGGLGQEAPMRITAEVKQPELIKKVEPPYPEVARKARIQGVVVLEAVITQQGSVEDLKVLRSLHPVLDNAAVRAVKQWRYKPAVLNGKPVKVYFTVTVNFTLR